MCPCSNKNPYFYIEKCVGKTSNIFLLDLPVQCWTWSKNLLYGIGVALPIKHYPSLSLAR